ncbi:hypothetical protein ACHAXT_010768 [Thalassiosira profunda]
MKTALTALSLLYVGSAAEQAPALRASLDQRPGVPAHFNQYAACLQGCGGGDDALYSTECGCVQGCIDTVEAYGITISDPEDVCDCVDNCREDVAEGNMEAPACYRACAGSSIVVEAIN